MSRAGRKRLDCEHGEIRSEKITVYLTPTQAGAIKLLSLLEDLTVADKINSLIDADIQANKGLIATLSVLKTATKAKRGEIQKSL